MIHITGLENLELIIDTHQEEKLTNPVDILIASEEEYPTIDLNDYITPTSIKN